MKRIITEHKGVKTFHNLKKRRKKAIIGAERKRYRFRTQKTKSIKVRKGPGVEARGSTKERSTGAEVATHIGSIREKIGQKSIKIRLN